MLFNCTSWGRFCFLGLCLWIYLLPLLLYPCSVRLECLSWDDLPAPSFISSLSSTKQLINRLDTEVYFTSEDSRFGFQFSACPGAGLSSGWFRGALHFGEEKEEDLHLYPAVPCLPGAPAGSCQQPHSSSFTIALPSSSFPLPTLFSLLPSEVSLPLPRMQKETDSSFSCATHMHGAPTMCLTLVGAMRI